MTNKEKYKDKIMDFVFKHGELPMVTKYEEFCKCDEGNCEECILHSDACKTCCESAFVKWSNKECKEHKIDWNKVPVDTKLLVNFNNVDWKRRYFAFYKEGFVYVFCDGCDSWSINEKNRITTSCVKKVEKVIFFDREEEKKYWKD